MPETKVAIRLGTDGAAQVRNDFREVGRAGTEAMQQIETASVAAGKAGETAADRQIAAWKRQAAAATSAAQAQARNAQFNSVLGVRDFDTRASEARRRELERAFAIEEGGLNRTQRVVAQASVLNFTQQVAAGTPVLRAFVTQASDIPTILAADEGGIAGGLAKVRGLLNPVTVGIGALTAVLGIGAAAWVSYTGAIASFDRLGAGSARTLGLTGEELNEIAVKGAEAARITVGASREIVTGYVQAGGIGRDVLQGLIGLTDDFAAATGREAKDAIGDLAAAFADPAKGAEDLARRYGLLSQAQIEQVRQLVDANDKFGAQNLLLEELAPLLDGSAQKTSAAAAGWGVLATKIDGAWQALGRFTADLLTTTDAERISRLEADKRFTNLLGFDTPGLDSQIAFLKRQAAERRQAAQQQAGDAQANIDAQKRADEAEKDAARRKADRAAAAKSIAAEAARARNEEIAERQRFVDRIRGVIADEERAEETRANNLARRLADETAASGRRVAGLQDQAAFAGDNSAAARLEMVRRAALRDAAADPDLNSHQIAQRAGLAVAEEQAEIELERANLLAQINSGQAQFVDLVTLANSLSRVGIDIADQQGRAIVAQVRAQQQAAAGMQEMKRFGGQLLDTVFNPDNWRDWGNLGKQVINMLMREFLVLATINPLKNALFGTDLPGLASLGGLFGKSRGGSMNVVQANNIRGFAMGTPWFGGGTALVGEQGPERVTLPRGSRIDTASATRRMLQGGGGTIYAPTFDLRGAVTTADLIEQMNQQATAAAVRGAAGGAALARADLARRARRRLI
ncbi:MAG: phage tail length tape measure family protein [Alphaproteobacteria bacterium]|nr:phage tail length tape measure family protein [Alphaproteobacteria bacterium]